MGDSSQCPVCGSTKSYRQSGDPDLHCRSCEHEWFDPDPKPKWFYELDTEGKIIAMINVERYREFETK